MKHFSIVKKAKVFFSISLIFLLVGVVSMLTRGFNLGIDFTGGSIIDVKFENPVTVSEVRDVLSDHKLGSSIIQLGSMDGQQTEESQSVLIRTGIISDDQRVETMTDMTNRLGPNEVLRVENVGATVGRDLVKSAMGAVALSWVLMIIYITIRFEHNFAFAAIIALIIDVMVTLSWFSLLQLEMDSSFVAALLTVVGYSINGTIVIFDRIRENLHTHRRSESLGDMVDNSIWQTMNRSIYTSATTLLPSLPSSCLVGRRFGTFLLLCLLALAVGSIRRPSWLVPCGSSCAAAALTNK
ncbi:protein translocase subunit SecF [Acidaminococcus intestini]|nr:protein translocase subunit SecF [Acidaminococcus intestini]